MERVRIDVRGSRLVPTKTLILNVVKEMMGSTTYRFESPFRNVVDSVYNNLCITSSSEGAICKLGSVSVVSSSDQIASICDATKQLIVANGFVSVNNDIDSFL